MLFCRRWFDSSHFLAHFYFFAGCFAAPLRSIAYEYEVHVNLVRDAVTWFDYDRQK